LPFGADIFDDENTHIGAVSQGGVIYTKVSKPKGTLTIKWGEDEQSQCQVAYQLNRLHPLERIKILSSALLVFANRCDDALY
jgi:outer membrane usher protein FimD/PapC